MFPGGPTMIEPKGKILKNGIGIIHIVRTHKGGGKGSSQMRTIAYKETGGEGGGGSRLRTCTENFFLDHKILKLFFFLYQRNYFVAIYYCV